MPEYLSFYIGMSILLIGFWCLCDLMGDVDVTKLTRLRIFFYVLLAPGTLFWWVVLYIVLGFILAVIWVTERPLVVKCWRWLTKPLN